MRTFGWSYRHRQVRVAYDVLTQPVLEPITLDEAKRQARIPDDESNGLLVSYIAAARQAAEECLGRGLLTQTIRMWLSEFVDIMPLAMAAPLQNDANASTAPVITYYDGDGVLQTLASSYYVVDTTSRPGRIVRAPNKTWPTTQFDRLAGAVFIDYVVGWTTPDDVPERIKQGMRMYLTYLDADRDGMAPEAALARAAAEACWSDRVYWHEPVCE